MEHAEAIVSLLDYCWFEQEIFGKRAHSATPVPIADQDQEIAEQSSGPAAAEFSRVPSILLRSMSDQLVSLAMESHSENSVLRSPDRLRSVESGKEISEEALSGFEKQGTGQNVNLHYKGEKKQSSRRRKKKALSKSLSELEFEEVKGFMDLGFIFSEEDKDSSLGSIIPGLHRLGKEEGKEEEEETHQREIGQKFQESDPKVSSSISRPYLSETWEWLDRRKKEERPLVTWNFPALNNEADMKDNLRWWAHTVASTVR